MAPCSQSPGLHMFKSVLSVQTCVAATLADFTRTEEFRWMDGIQDGWNTGWMDGWMEYRIDRRNTGWMDGGWID